MMSPVKRGANISVVTCSRNRTSHLKNVVESTSSLDNLLEHIIIDFSSSPKITGKELVEINPKVRIIRVENENSWWLTRAYNFGCFFAKGDYLLKLDADTIINSANISKIPIQKNDLIVFEYEGNGRGNFIVKKSTFERVNGFNEYIFNWGYDDVDLINRISEQTDKILIFEADNYIDVKDNTTEERFNSKILNEQAAARALSKTNSIVSKDIIWDTTKKFLYTELDTNIYKINHFFSSKEKGLKFTNYIKSTFLRIYLNELLSTTLFNKISFIYNLIPLFLINKILQIKLIPKKTIF